MRLPSTVHIIEVGPRDGFQAERTWIPTERKYDAHRPSTWRPVPSLDSEPTGVREGTPL